MSRRAQQRGAALAIVLILMATAVLAQERTYTTAAAGCPLAKAPAATDRPRSTMQAVASVPARQATTEG